MKRAIEADIEAATANAAEDGARTGWPAIAAVLTVPDMERVLRHSGDTPETLDDLAALVRALRETHEFDAIRALAPRFLAMLRDATRSDLPILLCRFFAEPGRIDADAPIPTIMGVPWPRVLFFLPRWLDVCAWVEYQRLTSAHFGRGTAWAYVSVVRRSPPANQLWHWIFARTDAAERTLFSRLALLLPTGAVTVLGKVESDVYFTRVLTHADATPASITLQLDLSSSLNTGYAMYLALLEHRLDWVDILRSGSAVPSDVPALVEHIDDDGDGAPSVPPTGYSIERLAILRQEGDPAALEDLARNIGRDGTEAEMRAFLGALTVDEADTLHRRYLFGHLSVSMRWTRDWMPDALVAYVEAMIVRGFWSLDDMAKLIGMLESETVLTAPWYAKRRRTHRLLYYLANRMVDVQGGPTTHEEMQEWQLLFSRFLDLRCRLPDYASPAGDWKRRTHHADYATKVPIKSHVDNARDFGVIPWRDLFQRVFPPRFARSVTVLHELIDVPATYKWSSRVYRRLLELVWHYAWHNVPHANQPLPALANRLAWRGVMAACYEALDLHVGEQPVPFDALFGPWLGTGALHWLPCLRAPVRDNSDARLSNAEWLLVPGLVEPLGRFFHRLLNHWSARVLHSGGGGISHLEYVLLQLPLQTPITDSYATAQWTFCGYLGDRFRYGTIVMTMLRLWPEALPFTTRNIMPALAAVIKREKKQQQQYLEHRDAIHASKPEADPDWPAQRIEFVAAAATLRKEALDAGILLVRYLYELHQVQLREQPQQLDLADATVATASHFRETILPLLGYQRR